jgi:hypothetical protein
LQAVADQLEKLKIANQAAFDKQRSEYDANFSKFCQDLNGLAESHLGEIETIRRHHEKAMKESSLRQEGLHRSFLTLQDALARDAQSCRAQGAEEKVAHSMTIENMLSEQRKVLEDMKAGFRAEQMSIEASIAQRIGDGAAESQNLLQEVKLLNSQKGEIVREFGRSVANLGSQFQRQRSEVEGSNEKELKSIKSEIDSSIDLRSETYDIELLKLTKDLDLEYEETRIGFDEQYYIGMKTVHLRSEDRLEIDQQRIACEEEQNILMQELDEIRGPIPEPVLIPLGEQIQHIKQSIHEGDKAVWGERADLRRHWQERLDRENARHRGVDLRDYVQYETLDSLRAELDEIRNSTSFAITRLDQQIAAIGVEFGSQMRQLEERKQEAANGQIEINQLARCRDELRAEKQSRLAMIREVNGVAVRSIFALIDEAKTGYIVKLNELVKECEAEDCRFAKRKAELKSSLQMLTAGHQRRVSEENAEFDIVSHKLNHGHDSKMSEIRSEIEAVSRETENQRRQSEDQRKAKERNFLRQSSEQVAANTGAAEKYAADFAELRTFWEDRVGELVAQRDRARAAFESGPPRPEDVDAIEDLEKRIQLLEQHFQAALGEAAEWRKFVMLREKELSRRFGSKPSIGIFDSRPKSARS